MMMNSPLGRGRAALIAFSLPGSAAVAQVPAAVMPQASRLLAGQTQTFSVIWAVDGTRGRAVEQDEGKRAGAPAPVDRASSGFRFKGPAVEFKRQPMLESKAGARVEPKCLWSLLDENGKPFADDEGGRLDDAGCYTAPAFLKAPLLVKIRAANPDQPERGASATLLVLPSAPFAILDRELGPDWLEAFTGELPFKDLAAGGRFDRKAKVEEWSESEGGALSPLLAGFGRPVTLRWEPQAGPLLLPTWKAGCRSGAT